MASTDGLTRKEFVTSLIIAAATVAIPAMAEGQTPPSAPALTTEDLKVFEKVAAIEFTEEERKGILETVTQARGSFIGLHRAAIDFTTEPSTVFTPLNGGSIPGSKVKVNVKASAVKLAGLSDVDIAYLSVAELGRLIREKKLTSTRLTQIYVDRLKQFGDTLLCVVTLMEASALQEAAAADAEIAAGHYRGPLHGIPYGIKDLFATKNAPTTWGANNFEGRMIDFDATVVKKLRAAGAVLVAKLSMGALAQGDVWFRGTTKNPWNPKQGSSGSSAGSAASTAAGLVAFAIGTETLGSIVSPSQRCRVFGLRPTYGRVSRYGGMALSYTMDKAGAICRYPEDTALVLAAICGSDPDDPSAVDRPFLYDGKVDFHKLKIGVLVNANASVVMDPFLKKLADFGATLAPVSFTAPPPALFEILEVEASSAFDAFTRGEEVRKLKNSSWPETFRAARFVTAVDYVQAQRARSVLMKEFEHEFGDCDMFVTEGGGYTLGATNLTGHPQLVIPQKSDGGTSVAKCLVGRHYDEARMIAVASKCIGLDYHTSRPALTGGEGIKP